MVRESWCETFARLFLLVVGKENFQVVQDRNDLVVSRRYPKGTCVCVCVCVCACASHVAEERDWEGGILSFLVNPSA